MRFLRALAASVVASVSSPASGRVDEPSKIDIVSVTADGSAVQLSMVQQHPWSEETDEKVLRKINTYIAFVQGGQLYETYPQTKGKKVIFAIRYFDEPGERSTGLLEQIKKRLATKDIHVEWSKLKQPK
jgi:hypothetical protein